MVKCTNIHEKVQATVASKQLFLIREKQIFGERMLRVSR